MPKSWRHSGQLPNAPTTTAVRTDSTSTAPTRMRAALGAAGKKNRATSSARQIQVRVRDDLTITRQTRSFRRPASDMGREAGEATVSPVSSTWESYEARPYFASIWDNLSGVKRLIDLTVEDLEASPVWRYEGGSGARATVAPAKRVSLSQADDEIFLAATEFQLVDASQHFGFCFPADDSGIDYLQPVIIRPARHVNFWFDGPAQPATL